MTFEELDLSICFAKEHIAYAQSVKQAEDMSVHILGTKPVRLLERMRPREDPAVRAYRLESYESITTAVADKGIFTIQKMMNPKLWSIVFPEGGKDLEQYLMKDYPFYGSLMTYTNDVIIRMMLADPNAVVVVMPINWEIPDTVQAQPIASIIGSARIKHYEYGVWYLILDKIDPVTQTNYFYYIDGVEYVYFKVKKEVNNQITYNEIKRYVHNIGEAPVTPLGGLVTDVHNNALVYRSYFSAALPNWNKAITADSDLDGAFINHMHPIRVEVTEECDYSFEGMRCMSGKIDYNGKVSVCPQCHGTGRRSIKSPYGVYQVTKPGLGDVALGMDPVSYVNVPTEPTRMLAERVQAQLDKGLEALNMFVPVAEAQSGVAKVLDRSELYDFLLTLSSRIFDVHINNIIYYTAALMYLNNTKDKLPSISKPVSFDLLSINEVATVIRDAQSAGLSSSYIRAKMASLVQKDLFGVTKEQWLALDSLYLNTLSGFKVDDVITGVNSGLVDETDANIFFNIDKYLQELYSANPDFYKLPYEQKRAQLEALAEEEEIELPNNGTE